MKARSAGAPGHFCELMVTPLTRLGALAGTSRPLPAGSVTAAVGTAIETMATLAVAIAANSAAAAGASSPSRAAAFTAGAATTTASTSTSTPSGRGPMARANPVPVRRIARTAVDVRTVNPACSTRAPGMRPSPPRTEVNTGAAAAVVRADPEAARAAAATSDPPAASSRARAGIVARSDSRSAWPA